MTGMHNLIGMQGKVMIKRIKDYALAMKRRELTKKRQMDATVFGDMAKVVLTPDGRLNYAKNFYVR